MTNRFNVIIHTSNPRGVTEEIIISGTPKPGTCMTIKAAVEPIGNKFNYEVFNDSADGVQNEVAILLEDELTGRLVTEAWAADQTARVYFPIMGEQFQMLLKNIAGTGDAFAIGDKLIIDDGTGLLIATTGTPEMEPFVVIETQVALTADTLVLVRYTGN